MHKQYVIETQGLTRYFGAKPAVQSLNLKVPKGSVFGFLGRNGSGKTTTIRMLLGLLPPTRGSATILGEDCRSIQPATRARIGYMTESHFVYDWMTIAESARFQASFYSEWNQKLFQAVIDHFELEEKSCVKELSRGERAGLSLALTPAPDPELLILDDPALGLDPVARRTLMEAMVFLTRSSKRTIFFSSHQIADVERVADQIAILDKSVLRANCSVETFQHKVKEVRLSFDGVPPDLPSIPGIIRMQTSENEWHLTLSNMNDDILEELKKFNPMQMETIDLSLEDAVASFLNRQGARTQLTQKLEELV